MIEKKVVVLTDIHVGHRRAVCPPNFVMSDGSVYCPNERQLKLFHYWAELARLWDKPDYLVINGEPIDGQNPKSRGVESWTTNYEDQLKAAKELIDMFHAKKIYLTSGSGYHVEQGGLTLEERFGKDIHATMSDGSYAPYQLFLKVLGTKFHFAHHISGSTSGWNYRHQPISKEVMLMCLSAPDGYKVDIVVRSHNHYEAGVFGPTYMGVTTPSWILQTAFNAKRGIGGTIPHIGGIRFNVARGRPVTSMFEQKIFPMRNFRPPMAEG